MYNRAASQVLTTAQDGSDAQWLAALGAVAGPKYSFALPGGCDQMSCSLGVRPAARQRAIEPGRLAYVFRGALCAWNGQLDEPQPSDTGWSVAAHGSGTFGNQWDAEYTSYSTPGDPVIRAINNRGLRWTAPASWPSDLYLAQPPDSASTDITTYLNNVTTPSAYTWYVDRRSNRLGIFTPDWSTPTRLLFVSVPQGRTLAGYPTRIWIKYKITNDNASTGATATYGVTSVTNTAQKDRHGTMEVYADFSQAAPMTAAAAQQIGSNLLSKYQAASFTGPFTARPGQVRTMGGARVDLGSEQAGEVYQLMLAGGGFGGEVTPALPVTFLAGGYEYDEATQLATITPWQAPASDMASLLSNWANIHAEQTAA